jgi:hypothetical protein
LYSTKWSDGKTKKGWKLYSSKKRKSIEDSVGIEENGYPVPDLKKTMINTLRSSMTTPLHPTHT